MKAFIVICDCARVHPDGTFSLVRGGIDRVQAPRTEPIHFRGSFLARIYGELSEEGEHEFALRVLNEDGKPIAPDISGHFLVPSGGGGGLICSDFIFILPSYGRYTFALTVDRQRLDSWEIRAVESPEAPPGQKGRIPPTSER